MCFTSLYFPLNGRSDHFRASAVKSAVYSSWGYNPFRALICSTVEVKMTHQTFWKRDKPIARPLLWAQKFLVDATASTTRGFPWQLVRRLGWGIRPSSVHQFLLGAAPILEPLYSLMHKFSKFLSRQGVGLSDWGPDSRKASVIISVVCFWCYSPSQSLVS
jgi:hypothetical protein